jgi:hypothetical protein
MEPLGRWSRCEDNIKNWEISRENRRWIVFNGEDGGGGGDFGISGVI